MIKNIRIRHSGQAKREVNWILRQCRYSEQRFKPEIVIGDNCSIGEYTQITAINKITIGKGLLTRRYVYIGDNAHDGLS